MLITNSKQTATRCHGRPFATSLRLALITALLLLSGCSRTEWLYRNADWVLERYAVKALDVNEAQLRGWRPVLERILKQHLDREIPILEGYLELMARAVDGSPGDRVDAACLVSGATLIFTQHARLAVDLAVPLMLELDPRQINHLAVYMTERRTRFRERYLQGDETERRQARTVRLTRRIEGWTGSLDRWQQARVERLTASLPDVAAYWFGDRKRQEERLLQLLHGGADADTLHAHLLSWWVPWAGVAPGFKDQWKMAEAAFILLFDDLAVSLTDQQRQHFGSRVSSLRKDLAGLRGDAPYAVRKPPRELQCYQQRI